MADETFEIAIVGGGLTGLVLALALHQHSIPCRIYESREKPLDVGGALMLVPNGLKVLDSLGLYEPLKTQGYNFDRIYVQDAASKRILETVEYGSLERYGVRSLRIYRFILLKQLLEAVNEKRIPIHFGRAFDQIISETEYQVTWRFKDSSTATASLLIGADGIHSTVRRYLHRDLKPEFSGAAAVIAAIPTSQLGLSEHDLVDLNAADNEWPLPSAIIVPGLGGFVTAPQTYNGDEVLITVQRHLSEAAEARWASVDADKDHLRALFRQNADKFPQVVQNAVSDIPSNQLFIWPFYKIPRLERWTSAKTSGGFGRVLIMGDSAHAIPPNSGQGVNQAFEDAYIFAGLMARLDEEHLESNEKLQQRILVWQVFRQERINHVLELNKQMDLRRMPKASGDSPGSEVTKLDMEKMFSWLFDIDFEKIINQCATGVNSHAG